MRFLTARAHMNNIGVFRNGLAVFAVAAFLTACGGGSTDRTRASAAVGPQTSAVGPATGTGSPAGPSAAPVPNDPGPPTATGNIATDGINWLNYRRQQAGLSVLPRNSLIDAATLGHSNYQVLNEVTHVQTPGKAGFTAATLYDRLQQAGYADPSRYFYGEVISASTSSSGTYLAEELVTAIYHRFAVFEPRFKEIGAGSVSGTNGYSVLTFNFAANGGYGPGLGAGNIITWPVNGQTNLTRNFFSDFEIPDPVANANEVGYPVSVHADADVQLTVSSFTMRPRGGSDIPAKLLSADSDPQYTTTRSAISIVPLTSLAAGTTYDVAFMGTANGTAISKTWSFTTKP